MSYVGWPWWSSWDLLRLDAWNKWPKHILPNAGEFNGDESLHGIESIKLGQSSLNSLLRFWTMLDLTSSPLVIPPGKDRWRSPLPLVLVDIRAPKTKIATFWGVASHSIFTMEGFDLHKNPRWKLRIGPRRRDHLLQVPGSEEENFWRIWCMIMPVGTGDFTSPKSSKSTIVTTCLF